MALSILKPGIALSPQMRYNFYDAKDFKIYAGAGVQFTKYTYSGKVYKNNANGSDVPTSPILLILIHLPYQ